MVAFVTFSCFQATQVQISFINIVAEEYVKPEQPYCIIIALKWSIETN